MIPNMIPSMESYIKGKEFMSQHRILAILLYVAIIATVSLVLQFVKPYGGW